MADSINPTQKQIETSRTWRSYKALFAEIGRVKSVAAVNRLRDRLDAIEPGLGALFASDRPIALHLTRLARLVMDGRNEAFRPKVGRRPRPDYGKRLDRAYRTTESRYRIIVAFRARGLRDLLVGETFVSDLDRDLEILSNNLDEYRKGEAPLPASSDIRGAEELLDLARKEKAAWR